MSKLSLTVAPFPKALLCGDCNYKAQLNKLGHKFIYLLDTYNFAIIGPRNIGNEANTLIGNFLFSCIFW